MYEVPPDRPPETPQRQAALGQRLILLLLLLTLGLPLCLFLWALFSGTFP